MRALVTGGAGLIGSHLVDLLLETGHEVRILDNLDEATHRSGKPDWIPEAAEFIHGDVRDRDTVAAALSHVDLVFHEAAVGGFLPEIAKYVDTNCVGTAIILETIIKRRLNCKVVVASSQAIYGEGRYECAMHGPLTPALRKQEQLSTRDWEVKCPHCGLDLSPLPTGEESQITGDTCYATTKYFQERLVLGLGRQYQIPTVALRYSLTYGPRQSLVNPYTGICSIFATRILNGLPPVVYEDGCQTRDFVYVKDVARANLLVAEQDAANFRAFNVGTGVGTSVLSFVDTLATALGKKTEPVLRGEFRPGEVRHLFADTSNIKALGFVPRTDLLSGIREYVQWVRPRGHVEEYFSKAEEKLRAMRVVVPANIATPRHPQRQ